MPKAEVIKVECEDCGVFFVPLLCETHKIHLANLVRERRKLAAEHEVWRHDPRNHRPKRLPHPEREERTAKLTGLLMEAKEYLYAVAGDNIDSVFLGHISHKGGYCFNCDSKLPNGEIVQCQNCLTPNLDW